jgi:hypothetical protein
MLSGTSRQLPKRHFVVRSNGGSSARTTNRGPRVNWPTIEKLWAVTAFLVSGEPPQADLVLTAPVTQWLAAISAKVLAAGLAMSLVDQNLVAARTPRRSEPSQRSEIRSTATEPTKRHGTVGMIGSAEGFSRTS